MSNPAAKGFRRTGSAWAALACAAAALAVFLFYGNASRGWVNTPSLFWWWVSQWIDPNADSEHGWLILGLSAWLFWRNLRAGDEGPQTQDRGPRTRDQGPSSKGERKSDATVAESQGERRNSKIETRNPKPGTASPEPDILNGAAPLAAMVGGLLVHALGFAAQQARLSILALLLFTWGILRLAGGRRWGRAAMFPLAFMVFAIPVNVLDSLGFWLRMGVVDASAAIARAAGIPVVQSGTQLFAPDGRYNYDVAAACSGVRSLTAMVALSLLAGYLNFRGPGRRAFALLLSFPLVYLGNVARIVAIIFAAELGGPRWGDVAHEAMGFGIFVIVLGGVLGAIALIRRYAPEGGDEPVETGDPETAPIPGHADRVADPSRPPAAFRGHPAAPGECHLLNDTSAAERRPAAEKCHLIDDTGVERGRVARDRSGRWRTPAAAAALVVVVALGEMVFLHHLATSPARGEVGVVLAADGVNPVELPAFLGTEWIGRRAEVSAVEREILPPDTGFSRKIYVPLANARAGVLLSIVLSGRDRTSIHRPELCLVGQGWTLSGRGEHWFRAPGADDARFPATVLRVKREVATPRGHVTVPQLTVYWFIGGSQTVATHWQRVALDSWNRVLHARADRWAYVLMQTDASDGEPAALARMQAVLDHTLPVFQNALASVDRS